MRKKVLLLFIILVMCVLVAVAGNLIFVKSNSVLKQDRKTSKQAYKYMYILCTNGLPQGVSHLLLAFIAYIVEQSFLFILKFP